MHKEALVRNNTTGPAGVFFCMSAKGLTELYLPKYQKPAKWILGICVCLFALAKIILIETGM